MARRGNPIVNFIAMTIVGIALLIFGDNDLKILGGLLIIPALIMFLISKYD